MCKGKIKLIRMEIRHIKTKIMLITKKITTKITTKVRINIKKKVWAKIKAVNTKVKLNSPKINLVNFQSKVIRMKNKEKGSLIKIYV